MKKIISVCLLLSIAFQARAGGYITPLGSGVEIDKVQVLGSSGLVIWLKEDMPQNPDNCSENRRMQIKGDVAQYDAMVAVVLAVHAQNKKVGFWSSGCGETYFWGPGNTFPIIRDLWIN